MSLRFPKRSKHIKIILLPEDKVSVQSIPDGIKVTIEDLRNDTRKRTIEMAQRAKSVSDNPEYIGERLYLE